MENIKTMNDSQAQDYKFEFFGSGSEFFGIMIVNWLLCILTLGFYYPWARAKTLRYVWGQTALNDSRFHFSGTGMEIFKGFIKFMLLLLGLFILFILLMMWVNEALAVFVFYLAVLAIIPFAIHGGLKYMLSRTSYKGIRFGYRGDRSVLMGKYFKDLFLTIITFGIYGSWFAMNMRRYTHSNFRYGDVEFENSSSGLDFFILNLKGYLLTIVTLGIYSFWWQKNIFNYYVDNISLRRGDETLQCRSTATGGGFFFLLFTNLLILIFTLGLGFAWTQMRTYRFIWNNVKMEGDLNLDAVEQTEEEYNSAFGEDALDFLDINLI